MSILFGRSGALYRLFAAATVASILFTAGCGGGGGQNSNNTPVTYTIGGTISGLTGSGLVLQDNSGNNLTVSSGATTFTFTTALNSGSTYAVTVLTQPSSPGQACTVSSGTGTATANVTSVKIVCTTNTYTIGGTISGLTGSGLVLQDNSGNNLSLSPGATAFTFPTAINSGSTYAVSVLTQPSSPAQTCAVSGGLGTATANVTNVAVTCTNNPATSSNTVTGTASLGSPIAGGVVTLKDAYGVTSTGVTASDGTFTVNTGGLSAPFLVRVVTSVTSGSFPAGTTLYSVSADTHTTTNINVHVLSDLIVRAYYTANGVNADTAFANPTASGNSAPAALAVQNIANSVIQVMGAWFATAGVQATAFTPAPTGYLNLISSPFTANDTGLDAVLHETTETVNGTNGSVTSVGVAAGSLSETVNLTYPSGSIAMNALTGNSSSGAASSELVTALVLTSAEQADVTAINAQLAAFQGAVNQNSATLSAGVLQPFFAADYLNDGDTAAVDAAAEASYLAGATISGLQVQNVKSINTSTNVADVIASLTVTAGGQSQVTTQEFILKDESGSWLSYGDQRPVQVSLTADSRTFQGAGGVSSGTYIDPAVEAPSSVGLSAVTVSGGGNIWPGASLSLTQRNSILKDGQTFTDFETLSSSLGTNISQLPAPGTQFSFSLTTSSLGNLQYTLPSNSFTTEVLSFSGISSTSGSGPLSSIVGKTLTYHWNLPATYAVSFVDLFAYINDASSHSCQIDPGSLPVTTTTSTITIPANMSACGLSSSDAITGVVVYLQVQGANGEVNLVSLTYPY